MQLSRVLASQADSGSKLELLSRLRSGEVPCFHGPGKGLHSLLVDENVIALPAVRFTPHPGTVNRQALSQRFNLGYYEARALIVHLNGEFAPRACVEESRVRRFLREYVPVREIAQQCGVHPAPLLGLLLKEGRPSIFRLDAGSGPVSKHGNVVVNFVKRGSVRKVEALCKRIAPLR